MKTVVIADDGEWAKMPWHYMKLYSKKDLRDAYSHLFEKAKRFGLKLYKSNFKWYKNGRFTKGWEYGNGWKQVKGIKPDFIMDKGSLQIKNNEKWKRAFDKKKKILNPYYIEELCSNKMLTAKTYPSLVPKCFLVHNRKQLDRVMKKIRTQKVVLKPVDGSSAKGLSIADRDKLPRTIKKGMVAQEFVDASCGLRGFVKGTYDMRCVTINGKIVDCFIREAPPGKLTSNYSTGGKFIWVNLNKIPMKIRAAVKKIDSKLKKYKARIYTADFVIDCSDRLWLIEMNSKPGFFFYGSHGKLDIRERFEDNLIKAIKKAIMN